MEKSSTKTGNGVRRGGYVGSGVGVMVGVDVAVGVRVGVSVGVEVNVSVGVSVLVGGLRKASASVYVYNPHKPIPPTRSIIRITRQPTNPNKAQPGRWVGCEGVLSE